MANEPKNEHENKRISGNKRRKQNNSQTKKSKALDDTENLPDGEK